MNKRILVRLGFLCAVIIAPRTALQAQAAPASAPAPVSTQAPLPAATSGSAATPASAGGTKVWTNDDLGSLQGSSLSTVGSAAGKAPAATVAASGKSKVAGYRQQIAKLKAQLPPLDGQIADLQTVLSGGTVSGPRKLSGVRLADWRAQLAQLQQKRADIQSRIDALEDRARHDGVPANTLP